MENLLNALSFDVRSVQARSISRNALEVLREGKTGKGRAVHETIDQSLKQFFLVLPNENVVFWCSNEEKLLLALAVDLRAPQKLVSAGIWWLQATEQLFKGKNFSTRSLLSSSLQLSSKVFDIENIFHGQLDIIFSVVLASIHVPFAPRCAQPFKVTALKMNHSMNCVSRLDDLEWWHLRPFRSCEESIDSNAPLNAIMETIKLRNSSANYETKPSERLPTKCGRAKNFKSKIISLLAFQRGNLSWFTTRNMARTGGDSVCVAQW